MATSGTNCREGLRFFCGDDFTASQKARELFKKWSSPADGVETEVIDGAVVNSGEALEAIRKLREAIQTLPFFSPRKVVWLRNVNFMGTDRVSESKQLLETIDELAHDLVAFEWSNVRLIINAGRVDRTRSFYKTLQKAGVVEYFEVFSVNDKDWELKAAEFARREFEVRGKQVAEDALDELVNRVGPDMQQLANEAEKLSLYVGERREIQLEDVKQIAVQNPLARAFELADALGERQMMRLLQTLNRELETLTYDREKSEIGLLYGLISKIRAMIFAKEMMKEGLIGPTKNFNSFKAQLERVPATLFAGDKRNNPLSINPYVLFRAAQQAGNYSTDELVRAMEILLDANLKLVSGAQDKAAVLQQAVIRIAQPPARQTV